MKVIHLLQVCRVLIQVRYEDKDWVRLAAQSVELKENLVFLDFSIEEIRLDPCDDICDGQGIKLSFVLKRKMMGELFTTFLPSLLMLVLSHLSSTFLCPFKAAILLNLACLLIITIISCSSILLQPSKSSVNMVDIWLLLCYLTLISRVVLLMAVKRAESKAYSYKPNTKVRFKKLNLDQKSSGWGSQQEANTKQSGDG